MTRARRVAVRPVPRTPSRQDADRSRPRLLHSPAVERLRSGERRQPGSVTFPRPPREFADAAGRTIRLRRAGDCDRAALLDMYDDFAPESRAQGLPPLERPRIESWLEGLFGDGHHVAAWHGERVVGHACLVPAGDHGHELAIFVADSHQHAGVGTRLLRALLGHGRGRGVERAFLVVQRRNTVARNLYESAGFERVDGGSRMDADIEMARPL